MYFVCHSCNCQYNIRTPNKVKRLMHALLPPANEVWGRVIFLHLSVILFTGGEYLGRYNPAGTTPGQVHPPSRYTSWQVHPPGTRYTSRPGTPPAGTPPTGTPPRPGTPPRTRYTPTPWDQVHPPGRYPPREQCMLGDTATSGRYASYWNAFLLIHY